MSLPVTASTDALPWGAVSNDAFVGALTVTFDLVSPDKTATPTDTAFPSPPLPVAEREAFVSALAAILMPLPLSSAPVALRLPSITTSALLKTRETATAATTLEPPATVLPSLSFLPPAAFKATDCLISTLEVAAMSILLPVMLLFSPTLTDALFFLLE